MIAHYGYADAEGDFYIAIDTERCACCGARPCVSACPRALFCVEEDPYGEEAVAIDEGKRKVLPHECAGCKPLRGRSPLPCVSACPFHAISHSW
ncbi:MAG: hypothetical protein SCH98_00385 [Deferrisomatales bacterium]|nr:hypothetical protein [Deferrisomatales bacterium]